MSELTFSQRIGKTPIKTVLQVDTMDDDLRNGLWNVVYTTLSNLRINYFEDIQNKLWIHFYKKPIDEIPINHDEFIGHIKYFFYTTNFFKYVYDLIEFISQNLGLYSKGFVNLVNSILEIEKSGYRLVNYFIIPVTSQDEVKEIEEAASKTKDIYQPVYSHVTKAIQLFSKKEKTDYHNVIKESISAIESLCAIVTGEENATLGKTIKKIKEKYNIHPALEQAISSLYGYASDEDGVRHGATAQSNIGFSEAKFILVTSSAIINFIISSLNNT